MVQVASFTAAVEGETDAAVLKRVVAFAGGTLDYIFGLRGKGYLVQQLAAFNAAARHGKWIFLLDLDQDADCAPAYFEALSGSMDLAATLCLRIAVRKIESWILADPDTVASFLGVSANLIPRMPDALPDPKLKLVSLAGRSRRREVRLGIAPQPGSGRQVGPAYSSMLIEYVGSHWRPDIAAGNSDSLNRCIRSVRQLL